MKYIQPEGISSMKGFSILHALVSMIIFASLTVAGLQWQRFTISVDKGRNLGQQYLTLNSAVNNYMVTYYQSLIALKPACSEMTFTTTNPASPPSAARSSTDCRLTIATGKTVANGLQPSPAELITLGLLPASATILATNLLQIESPNLPTASIVNEYITVGPINSGPSQPRLFINIEMVCLQRGSSNNPNTGNAVPTTPGPTGCPSSTTTTAFQSMIFNTQPYNNNLQSYAYTFPALLGSVFTTLGDDAVNSGMTDTKLVNSGNSMNGKNFQLTHPITGGPSGIMGLRGGYGASYTMQHSRVDGSNPPTADWSFGGHGVSDISKLKLPVKVIGNSCDAKEDIALDAQAKLLVCKNSIWSTSFASPVSGSVDFSEYHIYDINAYPTASPSNSIKLYKCNATTTISCQLIASTDNIGSLTVIYGTASGYSDPTITCGQINTAFRSSEWHPELFETYETGQIVNTNFATLNPLETQIIIRYCTVGGIIFNRRIRLNKVNP